MTGIVNEVSDAVVGRVPIVLVGGTPEVTEAFLTCGSVGGSYLPLVDFQPGSPGLLTFCGLAPATSPQQAQLTEEREGFEAFYLAHRAGVRSSASPPGVGTRAEEIAQDCRGELL